MDIVVAILLVVLCGTLPIHGFYLPGAAPHDYHDGEHIEMLANVLTSIHTHMPYEYYQLPVCHLHSSQSSVGPKPTFAGNFGEIFLGNRLQASPYHLVVGEEVMCRRVCDAISLTPDQQKLLEQRIKNEYVFNFILDNLPLASSPSKAGTVATGVPLGFSDKNGKHYVNNHLHFNIKYYELSAEEEEAGEKYRRKPEADSEDFASLKRIISFTAIPMSIKHQDGCDVSKSHIPLLATDETIVWSYGVTWERTNEPWASRWDVYLNVTNEEVHWYSITNATLLVLFLTALVAMMVTFTLKKDIAKYNTDADIDDLREETGWKLVSKDVFRPPPYGWLLAALTGTGLQLLAMVTTVVAVSYLGFFSPQQRGKLFTALLMSFVLLGSISGFFTARFLKSWGMPSWKAIFAAGAIAPGCSFTIFICINIALWTQSSSAVPFSTVIGVMLLWFCVSLPLVFVGGIYGYKREPLTVPVAPNMIPRYIPPAPWHMRPYVTAMIGGIFPFGVIAVELFYILSAIWMNKFYYVFGFLILIIIILVIAVAEIAIVLCYFQLCNEDYRWWWGSFCSTGSCGIYMFISATVYFFSGTFKVAGLVPLLVYFGYMTLASVLFGIVTGSIGFIACFNFTRLIYSRIKAD